MEALMKKAKDMIEKLDFDSCVKLFNQLPSGHPMIDLVFDRMEAIDPERFEEWLRESEEGKMKLNDIVMASTQDTKIRVVVKLYGTSFRTEHFPEYFLESEEMDELMDREVVDIRVVDDLLEAILR